MGEPRIEKQTVKKTKGEIGLGGGSATARTANGVTAKKERKKSVSEPTGQETVASMVAKARRTQAGPDEVPEGLPKKYSIKSTFNTHDIMHSPVEKTLKILDKILTGERLFTM